MNKCNPNNERIKRVYFEWQGEAMKKSTATIDNMRKAIVRYETYTKYEDFKTFNKKKAIAFKKFLTEAKAVRAGDHLSRSTIFTILNNLKDFFGWLAFYEGYKRHLDGNDVEYFNLSEKEISTAKAKRLKRVPTLDQVRVVLKSMPIETDIQKRDRAIIAFTTLSGMRDSAITSLRLKHVNVEEELIEQLPVEGVRTKASKTIYTYFFPVGDDIKLIATDWINYLYKTKLYSPEDPLFPRTKLSLDINNEFKADGIERVFWKSANRMRLIFKEAFENAGLEYFNPHSFRDMVTNLGYEKCESIEDFKGWSQNIGHSKVFTTLMSYGEIPTRRQGEIMKSLTKPKDKGKDDIKEIKSMLSNIANQIPKNNH